jgi:hypothetical protein
MRSYVRRWITQWDLSRLYGQRDRAMIEEVMQIDYLEDLDFDDSENSTRGIE